MKSSASELGLNKVGIALEVDAKITLSIPWPFYYLRRKHYLSDTNRLVVSSKGLRRHLCDTTSRRRAFAGNVESVCIA